MTEIRLGDGEPFEVTDVVIDYSPNETATHLAFGELTLGEMKFDFPAVRQLLGIPEQLPTRSIALQIPGKRYWWKPWRRRPGRTLHFNAVAVWPRGDDDAGQP